MPKRDVFHIFKGAVENDGEREGKKRKVKAEQGRTGHELCDGQGDIISSE